MFNGYKNVALSACFDESLNWIYGGYKAWPNKLMEIYKYVDIDCHWPFLLKIDQADLCQHPNKSSNQSVIQSLAEELVFDLARQSCLLIWANVMCSVEFKAQLGLHINLSLLSIFCLSRRGRHINHLSWWCLSVVSVHTLSVGYQCVNVWGRGTCISGKYFNVWFLKKFYDQFTPHTPQSLCGISGWCEAYHKFEPICIAKQRASLSWRWSCGTVWGLFMYLIKAPFCWSLFIF